MQYAHLISLTSNFGLTLQKLENAQKKADDTSYTNIEIKEKNEIFQEETQVRGLTQRSVLSL